jgi:cyclopropane-fatty-acyl-phospholipid synthase
MSRTVNERIILGMLTKLSHGTLTLTLPSGEIQKLGVSSPPESLPNSLQADLHIFDSGVFTDIVRGGDIAFAECFMAGRVRTKNLPALLKLFVKNREAVHDALHGRWWGVLFDRLRHVFRRNSKAQARKNIEAHYDLGNDFYTLWLDPSMTYSSALFASAEADSDTSLSEAQQAKYQRVLGQLGNAQNILEIGCGWGGFAEVASKAGRHVTGLTLSTEQLIYAKERLAKLGRMEAADLKLQDYRDEGVHASNQYDGVASIEMFEAVGESYWPSYFECISRNLKPGGKACIQSITIRDELFERYRSGTDFIQRYIFPGGMLPSPSAFQEAASRAGLRVVDRFAFGQDYARTLAMWRSNFLDKLPEVRALRYPEKFIRMWDFYLAYCEAGFESGDTNVMHFTLEKS